MHVSYDHQVFAFQQYGGISRYFVRLMEGLLARDGCSARIIAPLHVNAYLSSLPPAAVCGFAIPAQSFNRTLARHVGKHLAPLLIARDRPSLVHETYFARRGSAPTGVPTVLTVYDMIHEKFPQFFSSSDPTADLKRRAVLRADLVLCISESTKRDLIAYVPEAESKAIVTLLGFDRLPMAVVPAADAQPYLLYVGERRGYKNFEGFIRAFASSPRLVQDFVVCCFGGGPARDEEMGLIAQLGLGEGAVTFIGGSDEVLGEAYRQAAAFVYPSLYEGFGIPPLESMAFSCPVAASNRSSIPEVCGDAASYFDPEDTESIRTTIEDLVYDSAAREAQAERGRNRLAQFSWSRCTDETFVAYSRLL